MTVLIIATGGSRSTSLKQDMMGGKACQGQIQECGSVS